MEIKTKWIPNSSKALPNERMIPTYITIHETDNPNKGANANAHARLQYNGNSRQASWHYTVDDKEIWQSIPDTMQGWHAGNSQGNKCSIGIEICVNSDGNFEQAKKNAAWLVRQLMQKHNIPISKVVQHNHWSGKNCPRKLRQSGWSAFIQSIQSGEAESVKVNDFYDVSLAKGYNLEGQRSSKDTGEIAETVSKLMQAEANFILVTKRGADKKVLRDTLIKIYEEVTENE